MPVIFRALWIPILKSGESIPINKSISFEINFLINLLKIKNEVKNTRIKFEILKFLSFKEDENEDGKSSSALGSLGLKPKPAI